jgi:hypothetical protein
MDMVGKLIAASAALIALVVSPLAPLAEADASSPTLIQSGGVLCVVSANDVSRGGGPMVVCQRSDGAPWAQAPFSTTKPWPRLNLAVVRGSAEFYWDAGDIAGPQPVNLGSGQTYHVNGWTIQVGDPQTTYLFDATKHGISVGPDFVRSIWV